jgi:hypothetical protein
MSENRITKEDLEIITEVFKKLGLSYIECIKLLKLSILNMVPQMRKDEEFMKDVNMVVHIQLMKNMTDALKLIQETKRQIMLKSEADKLLKNRIKFPIKDLKNKEKKDWEKPLI